MEKGCDLSSVGGRQGGGKVFVSVFGWEEVLRKPSVDIQEPEEWTLEVQKQIFNGTRARRKRGEGVGSRSLMVALVLKSV